MFNMLNNYRAALFNRYAICVNAGIFLILYHKDWLSLPYFIFFVIYSLVFLFGFRCPACKKSLYYNKEAPYLWPLAIYGLEHMDPLLRPRKICEHCGHDNTPKG